MVTQKQIENRFFTYYHSTNEPNDLEKAVFKELLPGVEMTCFYNPGGYGWCGYSCVAFAFFSRNKDMADRMGSAVRLTLYEFYVEHQNEYTMLTTDNISAWFTLTPSKESVLWWFVAPEMLYLVSAFWERSVLYAHPDSKVPYLIDYNGTPPEYLFYIKDAHFVLYCFDPLTEDYTHDKDFEQENFDKFCKSIKQKQ